MSRLGIAFVLPYTGANGIVVNNNVIGIDANANVDMGSLSLNRNQGQIGKTLLSIYPSATGLPDANASLLIDNLATASIELTIDSYGLLENANGDAGQINTVNLVANQLQNAGTGNAWELLGEDSTPVVVDLTKSIMVNVDGNNYRLITAV